MSSHKEVNENVESDSDASKKDHNGIVLIPQPTDDPEDPLVCVNVVMWECGDEVPVIS